MSSHHDDHHAQEQKPVAFTVPFILAAVLVFIIVMFLSLCDPKPHHGHEGHEEHGAAATEMPAHHNDATMEAHAMPAEHAMDSTHVEKDTVPAESTEPTAEPAHH